MGSDMKKTVIILSALVFIIFLPGCALFGNPTSYSLYSPGDPFIINIRDSGKLFKTAIVLELNDERTHGILAENNAQIRDKIIFILRGYDEADFNKEDIDVYIRKKITETLNKALRINNITGVLFNDFYVYNT